MKTSNILLMISIPILVIDIFLGIVSYYNYSKSYDSYWSLAEKASSLESKIIYIDKFVEQLEKSGLDGEYNALFLETPDNSFDENLGALKSLQKRLHEIKTMDIKSFEYQTAMQQITQQEQGEADKMMDVFYGVWMKNNYLWIWDWIGLIQIIGFVIVLLAGFLTKTSE